MALAPTTGSPPAITHDQIEAWTKIADDVTAALAMGGQQGFDFLINIMAEWCEAVDDVNAARQICLDFADRGLRHEAIHWHADGFFEVADKLDPDRPGWEAWEATFQEQGVVTPRVDQGLREMANRIHEDLQTQDLTGRSLADHLIALRRNMLSRGHLGERLVILESIRGLDPAGEAWQAMISPIRRRRVDMIADEVKAAIARKDFEALVLLREEVASQDWGDDLPGTVTAMLAATAHYQSIEEYRGRLSQTAAIVIGHVEEARRQPYASPGYSTAVQGAETARAEYTNLRKALVEAVRGGSGVAEVAALVTESGVRDAVRQLDAVVNGPSRWLNEQAERARTQALIGDIEAEVLRHLEAAPRHISDREAFQGQLRKWQRQGDEVLEKSRKAAARLPRGIPATTERVFQSLGEARKQCEAHLNSLRNRERLLVAGVLGGVGLAVMTILGILVVAVLRR